jgi:hypothetical protein
LKAQLRNAHASSIKRASLPTFPIAISSLFCNFIGPSRRSLLHLSVLRLRTAGVTHWPSFHRRNPACADLTMGRILPDGSPALREPHHFFFLRIPLG